MARLPQLGLLVMASLAVALSAAGPARADGPGDGVYGRFDADLSVQLGVGAGALREGGTRATSVVELRARVIDAAGLSLALDATPSGPDHLFIGAELRPLWPGLFLTDRSSGHERWDLLFESLGVELGAGLTPLGSDLGVSLSWGFGLEIPLVLPEQLARGLWLRLGARRQVARAADSEASRAAESSWLLYATLAIRGGLDLGFATWEPPRYELPTR